MSVLQYPDGINPTDVQIWNNAAFDNGDSWLRPADSFESDMSSKENQTPLCENSCVNLSSPIPIKPLNPNGAMENSRIKPTRKSGKENDLRDEKKIEMEISENLVFWKLQEIEEESLSIKERGKSSVVARTMVTPRQAVTTIASKKNVKKDDGFLSSVQPKKLFKDGEKSNKKPQRRAHSMPCGFGNEQSVNCQPRGVGLWLVGIIRELNQSSVVRKRSLPENDKDIDIKRNEKK
ncbi:hypothetical protein K7X08_005987 [Anisodus acutangulus]|uniref:Uncharacterized protein n=1 Tax=Anisodus acutangulus TaxID=402998 RepID=A0A9Q1LVX2_9SOLA|nr:hypothetical protein K7X08_005987 [Anisodus acutangulus]